MAALELRNKTYRVVFMFAGRKFGYALNTGDRTTAEALRGSVEKTFTLIEQKILHVPDDADVIAFVKAGGRLDADAKPPPAPLTLAQQCTRGTQGCSRPQGA
jgi:hypothetical protein